MIEVSEKRTLPEETGVYFFYDRKKRLLYIGKAKNIRSRVLSHFRSDRPWKKQIAWIDCLLLEDEEEALLTERELITTRRPRYNIRLRDDKSYPSIAVSLDEDYPRVFLSREAPVPGRLYFGPFGDARRARKLIETLPKIFPFRSCPGPSPGRSTGNPCLDYHIGLCGAPCVGKIGPEEYNEGIEKIIDFLSGRRKKIETEEERAMQKAAEQKQFEKAALHRDRLQALRSLRPRKRDSGADRDVLGVFAEGDEAAACLLEVREGTVSEQRNFLLQGAEGKNTEEIAEEFLKMLPSARVSLGRADALYSLAERNAKLHLLHDRRNRASGTLSAAEALAEIGEIIGSTPFRIEGYDIANLHEKHTVGTMVVFEGGQRKKSHYRSFRIADRDRPDDYASLEEVLQRRTRAWSKMREMSPYDKERDASFASTPDLILIDGGRGQLSAVLAATEPLREAGCAVLALAKKEEQLFGPDGEVSLAPRSQGSMLLQRVRDEAHRTSNARHRSLRKKAALSSPLEGVRGIGPAKRARLLREFGSIEAIRQTSAEEISRLPGISQEQALEILRALD